MARSGSRELVGMVAALGVAAGMSCTEPTAVCRADTFVALQLEIATGPLLVGEERQSVVRAENACAEWRILDSSEYVLSTLPERVAISPDGRRVIGQDTGTVVVTATLLTLVSSASLEVLPPLAVGSVVLTPQTASILTGPSGFAFTARVLDIQGRELPGPWAPVSWSSTPSDLRISGGVASSYIAGRYLIRASSGAAFADAQLDIVPQEVHLVRVWASPPVIAVGDTAVFYASGYRTITLGASVALELVREGADEWTAADSTMVRLLPDGRGGLRVVALRPGIAVVNARMGARDGANIVEITAAGEP